MRPLPHLVVLTLILAACGGNPPRTDELTGDVAPEQPLEQYRQLEGSWIDNTTSKKYTCYERWSSSGDSALLGFGYVIAKGDTVFIEDLRITASPNGVVYSARIDSQNNGEWVPFSALATGPDSLVFENPGHDFPQCITYVKDSTGGWNVMVTGNENGVERSEHFRFMRQ